MLIPCHVPSAAFIANGGVSFVPTTSSDCAAGTFSWMVCDRQGSNRPSDIRTTTAIGNDRPICDARNVVPSATSFAQTTIVLASLSQSQRGHGLHGTIELLRRSGLTRWPMNTQSAARLLIDCP